MGNEVYEGTAKTPVMGSGMWSQAPKVTPAEYRMYGALAETIRLLGTAASSTVDAYSLACEGLSKAGYDCTTSDAQRWMDGIVQGLYELSRSVEDALRLYAQEALVEQGKVAKRHAESREPQQSDPESL